MEQKDTKVISQENALKRMMRICSRKEYSTYDIKQKLYKLQQSQSSIDTIISELTKNKFINDERFARSFIKDKLQFSKWGEVKIRYSLRQKQISDPLIDAVIEELAPNSLNEHLQTIVERKYQSVKGETVYDKRTKVIKFALGRGFNMNDIIRCLDKISTSDEEIW